LKHVRRSLAILVVFVSLLSLCVGCGNTANSGSTEAQSSGAAASGGGTQAGGDNIVLQFSHWDPAQTPAMQRMAADYRELYPGRDIEINVVDSANYRTKLKTDIPAGTGADIIVAGSFAAYDMIANNLFMDLTDRIANDSTIDLSMLPSSTLDIYTIDGRIYGIPKDFDTIALFYNKEMFDEAGIAYPDESWTWDDLKANAKALTNEDHYGFISTSLSQTGIANFIFMNGGKIVDETRTKSLLNSPENIETFKFFLSFITEDKSSPTQQDQIEITPQQIFMSEKAAMVVDGSWMVGTYDEALGDKFDIAPLPAGKNGRACEIHGLCFAMNVKTKYPEETWDFLRYASTKQAQAHQFDSTIPGYQGAADEWVANFPNHNVQVFLDAVDYAVGDYIPVNNPGGASDAMEMAWSRIWTGELTVEEGLAVAEDEMNKAMNE